MPTAVYIQSTAPIQGIVPLIILDASSTSSTLSNQRMMSRKTTLHHPRNQPAESGGRVIQGASYSFPGGIGGSTCSWPEVLVVSEVNQLTLAKVGYTLPRQ
ncbi:unnamed protein product [Arabis nemorensis]|uniref:Uncharacterized protein n=1 Tax=Arabis nemorensis TaxID=586526 RepID=A0A565BJ37_9BRAS|nr:unnamed protein product [Arabis nemorensis]